MGRGDPICKALRPGEASRECERCGRAYVPACRTQKYCPDCRERRKGDAR